MRVDHVPCGECVNESERIAVEHVLSKLRSHGAPNNRWIVLFNVPSAVNDRAIPDEIDLVCIGPSGQGFRGVNSSRFVGLESLRSRRDRRCDTGREQALASWVRGDVCDSE